MSQATKGPGEKYCSECAEIINAKAEICPKCGVRQMAAPSTPQRTSVVQGPASKDSLSCPQCGTMAKRGGYPGWVLWVAICLFPIGLLALLAEKNPTKCPSCGHAWQA